MVRPQHQNDGGQCAEVLRTQPLRKDEDRVVPAPRPASSSCAQRFVRVAGAIAYATDVDFLFPSTRFKGTKPLSPDSILEKSIRPALARIGVTGKQIGWHSFRHSLATNLRSLGIDIKVAQELMRHSSCRTTLDIYTRAVDQQKREASLKVVELMLPLELEKFQHPSAPSETEEIPNQGLQQTHCRRFIGGPDRDRTDDLFHAME
jgi:integrase